MTQALTVLAALLIFVSIVEWPNISAWMKKGKR